MTWKNILKTSSATSFTIDWIFNPNNSDENNYLRSTVVLAGEIVDFANARNMSYNQVTSQLRSKIDPTLWSNILADNDDFMNDLNESEFDYSDIDWEHVNRAELTALFNVVQREINR